MSVEIQKCIKCDELKILNIDNFYFRNDSKKFRTQCNACVIESKKQYYLKNTNKIKNYQKNRHIKKMERTKNERGYIKYEKLLSIVNRTHKKCSKCKIDKLLNEEFYRIQNIKIINELERKYWYGPCRECENNYGHDYMVTHPEMRKARAKKAWQRNKIRLQYDESFRKHRKEVLRKYRKDRLAKDPSYKLHKNISQYIRIILKNSGNPKRGKSMLKYIGYSMKDLKQHIECQFEPWMNWNNWGKYNSKTWDDNDVLTWAWNIDHIKSVSKFNYSSMKDSEFIECWALKNLRPLSAKQNILDGAHRVR